MAANITLKCGTGVASITYAWVNSSGTRTPSSGTKTTTGSVTMNACDRVWISSVTASSGYTSPYKIDGTSFTSNYTYYPSVGGTKNVTATVIPASTCTIYCRPYQGGGVSSFKLSVNGVKTSAISSATSVTVNQGDSVYVTDVVESSGYTSPYYYYYADSSYSASNYDSISNSINTKKTKRYIQPFATEKTTYTTHSVSIKSNHVTASITYQDKYGESHTLSLGAGNTLTFNARSGSSAYCKVSSIYSTSGYTTPIVWQYNTSSGGTATTTISEGGSNTVDTTYNRTIVITASEIPTTYYYQIQYKYNNSIVGFENGSEDSTTGYITVRANSTTAPSGYTKTGTYSAGGTGCTWNNDGYWKITATSSSNRAYCIVNVTPVEKTYYWRVRFISNGTVIGYTDDHGSTASSSYSVFPSAYDAPSGYFKTGTYAGSNGATWHADEEYWTVTTTGSSSRGYCDVYVAPEYYYYQIRYIYNDTLIRSALGSIQSPDGYAYLYTDDTTAPDQYEKTGTYSAGGTGCVYQSTYSRWKITTTSSSNRAYCIVEVRPILYQITLSYRDTISEEGLSISGGGSYQYGSVVTITATPKTGYTFDGWYTYISGVWTRVSGNQNYDVTVAGAMTYYAKANKIAPTIPTATIEITGVTSSSLSVKATLTNVLTFSDRWYLCISATGVFEAGTYTAIEASEQPFSYTFTGLSANTTYYFKVMNFYNGQRGWQVQTTTGTTLRNTFSWDFNNNLDNRRPTANEWLRLIQFIEQKFGTPVSQEAKNSVVVGGTLSAALFNELSSDAGDSTTVGRGTPISKAILYNLQNEANRQT